jgi:hypothetical protein
MKTANYDKASSEGWIDKQPKGLYWLIVPPDQAIEEDIRKGLIVTFPDDLKSDDRWSQFFAKAIGSINGNEYFAPNPDNDLYLGSVIDSGISPLSDMETSLRVRRAKPR